MLQPHFEGPSGEMKSSLGRRTGEAMHMTHEEEKAAREAVAGLLERMHKLGPLKQKELMNEILGLRRRLDEEGFESALRIKAAVYGIVIGEFPKKSHEATQEEIKGHASNTPLTASMEERIALLEDAVGQAGEMPKH